MRQIIPFKKELLLNTKINEVTSISLEHNLSLNDNNKILGEFIVSGDYKMTASSINREKFSFNLPVEIELDDNYDYEKAIVDIDNFYYELINDDIINVNIDVFVDAVKKEKIIIDEDEEEDNTIEDDDNDNIRDDDKDNKRLDINIDSNIDIDVNKVENSNNNLEKEEIDQVVSYKKPEYVELEEVIDNDEEEDNSKVNLFNTDSFSNDTYATYYVYIMKEDDSIDKVLDKFKTTKEELANYNDLSELKKGSKLIIPVNNE